MIDPALFNYLQSQQQSGSQQPQQQSAQVPYNPFDSGIKNAIASARESLGMTDKQQEKALRRSMLAFGDNIAAQPKQRGFFNNFGSAARALSPAIMAHDDAEDTAFTQNNALANQILAYKAAEEAKQMNLEDRAWNKQHEKEKLAEQKRYHDLMTSYKKNKLYGQQSLIDNSMMSEFSPITNRAEITAYTKDKKALGAIMKELNEFEEAYKNFRTTYADNVIDPMSAFSGVANPAKDLFGKYFNNPQYRKETADRKTLQSRQNKFVTSSERALKGGGMIGPRLIETFKEQGIYPSLAEDTPETYESKMKMIKEEVMNAYKAVDLSLRYGVRIDPSNVEQFNKYIESKNQPDNDVTTPEPEDSIQDDFVIMQNAKGEKYRIPRNEVNDALNDRLTLIEE